MPLSREAHERLALAVLREAHKTFSFADAVMVRDPGYAQVIDLSRVAGRQKSRVRKVLENKGLQRCLVRKYVILSLGGKDVANFLRAQFSTRVSVAGNFVRRD